MFNKSELESIEFSLNITIQTMSKQEQISITKQMLREFKELREKVRKM